MINNGNNDVQDVWTISPQNFDGNTGQWLQGRVQIEASGDPEYQVIYIISSINMRVTDILSFSKGISKYHRGLFLTDSVHNFS